MTTTEPCSVSVSCRVEWVDTDASGHYHHGTVIRWVEAAEAEMFRQIGRIDLYGNNPRVRYEVDYRSRVWFGDEVELRLTVDRVGRSSLTMHFVALAAGVEVASGHVVEVNAAGEDGRAAPWPEDLRALLEGQAPAAVANASSADTDAASIPLT